MTSLQTYQLLLKTAYLTQQQLEFSPEEIKARIDHLKYLVVQKKVPRLSLRKEILELEQQLQKVTALETKMQREKKQESAKIAVLKEQNAKLKRQLVATSSQDIQQKVDRLTHLLGESLAKDDVSKEVALSARLIKTAQKKKQLPLQRLEQRLEELKKEFYELKEKNQEPEKTVRIGQLLALLEGKLQALQNKGVAFPQGRHTLMFHPLEKSVLQRFDEELPLPPPPKMQQESRKENKKDPILVEEERVDEEIKKVEEHLSRLYP